MSRARHRLLLFLSRKTLNKITDKGRYNLIRLLRSVKERCENFVGRLGLALKKAHDHLFLIGIRRTV